MTWTILTIAAACLSAVVWTAKLLLKIGDGAREKVMAEVSEDAARKHKDEAAAYAAPARRKSDVVAGMREKADH